MRRKVQRCSSHAVLGRVRAQLRSPQAQARASAADVQLSPPKSKRQQRAICLS